jgi:hypothetical protein
MKKTKTLLLLLLMLTAASAAYACPMCADILERGKDAWKNLQFGRGIAWSILLMMSMPFVLVGGFGFALWRTARRNAAGKERP